MSYAVEMLELTKEFIPAGKLLYPILHHSQKQKPILAVNNVTLQVKSGEIFGLIGPNGAGKTTLIKILSCLIVPSKGNAYVAGYSILRQENAVKACIGLIAGDERSFYWRLTVRQNLHFFATLYNLSKFQANRKIDELSCLLATTTYLDRRFQECPTGIKQKLAIMRSLFNNPQVLFLDEPTKSLDPTTAKNLKDFIKERLVKEQGKTVFFTSHNLNEVEGFADRIAIMHQGRIKISGTLTDLCGKLNSSLMRLEDIYYKIIEESQR
ncbi:MAG: ABC transporter ATP-binding protein [Candidatus Omnitrophica bacterium]|nr:ABC transporter ATP-binding protein [Candidatus Omnitrophota bacterium]